MTTRRALYTLLSLCVLAFGSRLPAQVPAGAALDIQANKDNASYDEATGVATIPDGGVTIQYTDETNGIVVLTAQSATVNEKVGDITARGNVRIQKANEMWVGDNLRYNYLTKEMQADKFRLGKAPVYIGGEQLHGTGLGTNGTYSGTNALITTDDYSHPLQSVRASRFVIVPGKYVEAHGATLYVGDVPVFYFPYYKRRLTGEQNEFSFLPGYRSRFGPYLLSSYNWMWDERLSGSVHVDYREQRGLGAGPDFNYNLGKFGEGTLRYYYAHDNDPGTDPFIGTAIPHNRQRVFFNYNANPLTNLTIQSQVGYQSDPFIVRDFFESQYRRDIQPKSFFDVNQFWQNWSVDALAQPRVNPFWETVERLPDVRLTGFRQQLGNTPVYYESQSSVGYFRRRFADTNTTSPGDFSAARADTFHQLTVPWTFFGWLNITPRVGGRFTYYDSSSGPGTPTTNHNRTVFNTGTEVSFTASRVWSGVANKFFDVDGIRHIFQPSVDYAYVPRPSVQPGMLPQFDYEGTNNLRLLPLEAPEYNSIDSIDRQNTIRFGVNNRLQTKRNGEIDDLVNWAVYMDWNLRPRTNQSTFSDIYSDFSFKPRSWATFNSFTRYSIANEQFNLAQHSITLQPNSTWSWTVGHLYLRSGPLFGIGDNLYSSTMFYRLNENWGTRFGHFFDANTGKLQEQEYTIYRDLRSWTAALTFRALNNVNHGGDYTVAFTFSFKSFPRFGLGQDTARAASLVGY